MTTKATAIPRTLFSQPIVFVDSFEQAMETVQAYSAVEEFIIISDNTRRPADTCKNLFKQRNAQVFRIRPSGVWNTLLRSIGEVETARAKGGYPECHSLMFISLISPQDIASALKRHRAVANLSSREMFWLDTLKFGQENDDVIELALRTMPTVPAPVHYKNLTVQQVFDLSGFEFSRFTRPIHCVTSVTNMLEAYPFYTSDAFGETFKEVGTLKLKSVA